MELDESRIAITQGEVTYGNHYTPCSALYPLNNQGGELQLGEVRTIGNQSARAVAPFCLPTLDEIRDRVICRNDRLSPAKIPSPGEAISRVSFYRR
jgi:hypothetical protein